MKNTPVDYQTARRIIDGFGLPDFGKATIREVVAISTQLEQETGTEFIHMEMGVPGLKAAQVGVDAEIEALRNGIASIYPNINGTPEVKKQASRFIKAFINIDIDPECCVPVTGSMQGTYASFLTAGQCTPGKDTILFIDPGFPVQKQQIAVMGYKYESFDVYEYRLVLPHRRGVENHRRDGQQIRRDCHRGPRLFCHGFPQGPRMSFRASLPSERSPLYR